jgi:predicted Zn-dependent protease
MSKRFLIVVALLIAGVVLAGLGTADQSVNLSSVLSLWSDTVRDTDQVGLRLTRIGDAEEMKIGADLARSMLAYQPDDPAASAYVTDVAQSLLPLLRRRGIKYQFHVVESSDVNAFALPGGHVFVTSSLLAFLDSEAELSAVLGHEISHVDLRHCVERYQYRLALKKVGVPDELGWLAETAHYLAAIGYSRDQEFDADRNGERLTIEAKYDPNAASALFLRMGARFGEVSRPRAATPAGEMGQAVGEALGSYFRTHPLSKERAAQMQEMAARHRSGRFYVGNENLRRRISRSRQEFATEFLTF